MNNLLYFNAGVTAHSPLPGMKMLSGLAKIFKTRVTFVDRSNTIASPLRTQSLFPLPVMRTFSKTYENICDERAVELLTTATKRGCKIYVSWSGGIDSTTALVSLLKHATVEQRKSIVVLLTEDSIFENPVFYREHIRGHLARESSMLLPYLVGDDHIFVSGELNDQLFGAETTNGLIKRFGPHAPHKAYDRDMLHTYFLEKSGDETLTTFYLNLFERMRDNAPIDVVSNHDMIWWFSFAVKWQSVYYRAVSYASTHSLPKISAAYLHESFTPFFNTEDFQLWSMLNPDKKIGDGWHTYKWPAKDIIYKFTKDEHYRDTKLKSGSLSLVTLRMHSYRFIDDDMCFSDTINLDDYHNPINDFV